MHTNTDAIDFFFHANYKKKIELIEDKYFIKVINKKKKTKQNL